MTMNHDENFIKKGYRFIRGYPGPFGRWGKGVWGKKNLRNAMLGPAANALNGNQGGMGGMGGVGGMGGMGMGGMGMGGMGMFHE